MKKKHTNPLKKMNAQAAEAGLRNLPIPALVGTVNTMLGILRDRGFKVYDWDGKDRTAYKLIFNGTRIYILLAREDGEPPPPNKEESTDEPIHDPGG